MKLSDAERTAVMELRHAGIVSRQLSAPVIAEHRFRCTTMSQHRAEEILRERVQMIIKAYNDIDADLGVWRW